MWRRAVSRLARASSARASTRYSQPPRAGSSSRRLPRTSTACSRSTTLPRSTVAGWPSSAAAWWRTAASPRNWVILNIPEGTRLTTEELDRVESERDRHHHYRQPGRAAFGAVADGGRRAQTHQDRARRYGHHQRDTPIPGNEDLVMRTINRLFKQGANVIYEPDRPIHASGHGNQEDIKMMLNLLKPKFMIPVHGEERHYAKFVDLVASLGYPRESVLRASIGDMLETDGKDGGDRGQGSGRERDGGRPGSGGRGGRGSARPAASLAGRGCDGGGWRRSRVAGRSYPARTSSPEGSSR